MEVINVDCKGRIIPDLSKINNPAVTKTIEDWLISVHNILKEKNRERINC